jgi:serine/threonine-protein kinase
MEPAVAAVTFAPPAHSIAVLPFVNMSGDAKQEYFSDGISEELLNALSRLNELQVAARTSSFSFKGQNVDISTIARKLNVGSVLEGSVRRAGNTVRITAQLINAVSGFHMWSQTYDRNVTDILKVQTEVATSVAKQLEVQLAANEVARIELGGTNNVQAYDAYLRGAQLLAGLDPDESVLRAALAEFERAISLDPEYAAAYAQRARTLDYMSIFVASPTGRPGLRRQAREAAERAVALSPEFGEAHLELAQVRAYGLLDFRGALPEFDHALALAPGSARVQRAFAGFASSLGHFEQATIAAGRAIRLDPRNAESYAEMAQVNYDARQYGEALIAFQHVKALGPRSHYIEGWIIMSLIASGQIERARQDCEALLTPLDQDDRHYCLALVYHALGRQGDGERELEKLRGIDEDHSAYTCATIYAQWGNKAEALRWLAKAEQLLGPGLQSLRVNWTLDPIRNAPEFKAIEARMNFPP